MFSTPILVSDHLFDYDAMARSDESENYPNSMVIDSNGTFTYVALETSPGKIVKINMASLLKVGDLTLSEGENSPSCLIIDPADEFIYVGTGTRPGKIFPLSR